MHPKEKYKNKAWKEVGDDHLFPNHNDQDIWNKGFEAGWKAYTEYINDEIKQSIKRKIIQIPDDGC